MMHQFNFTFDFKEWTDGQIERLIDLLEEVGEYDKRNALLKYLYPLREDIVTIVELDGKQRTFVEQVRSW